MIKINNIVDSSWNNYIKESLSIMDQNYLAQLNQQTDWLPGITKIFNAFSLPLNKIRYILLGESPYPRKHSANGYAFWDAAVGNIWSETGLTKPVNRATSLRNIIKMLLVADNKLPANQTQQIDIANLDKSQLIQTNDELFQNILARGFLLLNTTLAFEPKKISYHAKYWQPFIHKILNFILIKKPKTKIILLGNIAKNMDQFIKKADTLIAEHPYNLSFIQNKKILTFFRPLSLLKCSTAKI